MKKTNENRQMTPSMRINVNYRNIAGYHYFNSADLQGLHVGCSDLELALQDLSGMIGTLLKHNQGLNVKRVWPDSINQTTPFFATGQPVSELTVSQLATVLSDMLNESSVMPDTFVTLAYWAEIVLNDPTPDNVTQFPRVS